VSGRSSNTPPSHFPPMSVLQYTLESSQMHFLHRIWPTSRLCCFTLGDPSRSFEGRGNSQSPSSFFTSPVTKFARESKLSSSFHPKLCQDNSWIYATTQKGVQVRMGYHFQQIFRSSEIVPDTCSASLPPRLQL
jgi:hypothetical protein